MDDKKQIEEMARIICKPTSNRGNCDKCGFNKECSKFDDATTLYTAGYREQVEGEIKGIVQFGDECWLGWCSECGKELKGRTKIALILEHRYCSNCGAKMKGGHTDEEWEKAVENVKMLRSMALSIPTGFFYIAGCNKMLQRYESGDRSEELFEEMRDAH